MTGRRGALLGLASLAGLLLLGRWGAGLYADHAWLVALGDPSLADALLRWRLALHGVAFVLALAITLPNAFAVRHSVVSIVLPRRVGNVEIGEAVPRATLDAAALGVAVLIAAALSLAVRDPVGAWLALRAPAANEFDPYLLLDLSFWRFWLPFEARVHAWAVLVVGSTTLAVVALYALTPSLRMARGRIIVSVWVRRHLGLLAAALSVMLAWTMRLEGFDLLREGHAPGGAFGAIDHQVIYPWLFVGATALLFAALLLAWSTWTGMRRLSIALLSVIILAGPVTRMALPSYAMWASPAAGATDRDASYLVTRRLLTQRAFGTELVRRDSTAGLQDDRAFARAVALWETPALWRAARSQREDAGVPTALLWGVRDSVIEAVTLRRVERDRTVRITRSGIDPTARELGPLPATDLATVWVAADDEAPRVVRDSGERLAGPPFATLVERILHAWAVQRPRLLGEPGGPNARLMGSAGARSRVARLLPPFVLGATVRGVLRGDSLFWIVDAYSASDAYPISEPILTTLGELRAARFAARAIVSATTGRVMLVAQRDPDPLTKLWMQRFPTLWVRPELVAEELGRALPPPAEWLSLVGSAVHRSGFVGDSLPRHGIADADDADLDLADGDAAPFLLPGRGLALAVPTIDPVSEMVDGLLVATGGVRPALVWHPVTTTRRWAAVLEGLERAADSAGFGRGHRGARRGRVQSIPTATGLRFDQSFYEWPPDGGPRPLGVALLDASGARTGLSIGQALGMGAPERVAPTDRGEAARLYDAMRAALQRGDWLAFGAAFDRLGRLLGRR
ncbi:MAG: UPF0182 family protein [Gemmatimonadaceae bacterium]|nr:UPF0182 family protein [Gemmatimonadaceae bacterium]